MVEAGGLLDRDVDGNKDTAEDEGEEIFVTK